MENRIEHNQRFLNCCTLLCSQVVRSLLLQNAARHFSGVNKPMKKDECCSDESFVFPSSHSCAAASWNSVTHDPQMSSRPSSEHLTRPEPPRPTGPRESLDRLDRVRAEPGRPSDGASHDAAARHVRRAAAHGASIGRTSIAIGSAAENRPDSVRA